MAKKRINLDDDLNDAPLINNPKAIKTTKEKEITVSFRCTEDIKAKLANASKAEDRSISWIIKKLINENL